MYTLTLTEEQVEAVRVALTVAIDAWQHHDDVLVVRTRHLMGETNIAITDQWHEQYMQRKEGNDG